MTGEEAQALALIDEARVLLKAEQGERALWRLIDAAGLVSQGVRARGAPGPLAGWDESTGRGFRLVETEIDNEPEFAGMDEGEAKA